MRRSWTASDDQVLRHWVEKEVEYYRIANHLDRSMEDVRMRIRELGMERMYERYRFLHPASGDDPMSPDEAKADNDKYMPVLMEIRDLLRSLLRRTAEDVLLR